MELKFWNIPLSIISIILNCYKIGSEHVRSSVLAGFASSIWRTVKSMGMQGDVKQQGGQLVLGPGK